MELGDGAGGGGGGGDWEREREVRVRGSSGCGKDVINQYLEFAPGDASKLLLQHCPAEQATVH